MTKTLAFLAGLWSVCLFAQDATLLAPGDALSPEEQRVKFHLPPGFEIQLVASEPDIGQPMNLQFDTAGRLWITSSVEYPYPAEGPGVEARDENFAGSDEPHPAARLGRGAVGYRERWKAREDHSVYGRAEYSDWASAA